MNLSDYFNQHFEIVSADTDLLLDEVFRLRYQVYCIENVLADKSKCQDFKEGDPYDAHSIHQLIRHKPSGLCVASVRFILPDPANPEKLFPMEAFCRPSFYPGVLPPEEYPHALLSEVSRFLVSRQRERQIMELSSEQKAGLRSRSIYKRKDGLICYLLLFGLISAVLRVATEKNLSHWYVSIEAKLLRLFRMLGINFLQLGPMVEYHGKRLPCLGTTSEILSGIRQYRPELYAFVTKGHPLAFQIRRRPQTQYAYSPLQNSA